VCTRCGNIGADAARIRRQQWIPKYARSLNRFLSKTALTCYRRRHGCSGRGLREAESPRNVAFSNENVGRRPRHGSLGRRHKRCGRKVAYFLKVFVFKDDVGLREKISAFSTPAYQGLRNNFPPLKEAPESVLFLIVLKCIEKSGTHSRSQIETAIGIELPD
jgi:hypothetical protein